MNEAIIPMVIVPLTFLFVLLIILIAKAPKAGAWVIGGLLLLAPVILYRFAAGGALAHEEAIPLFVVPVTFLFVLLVILLAKAPKIGAGLIVALIVMVVAGFFFVIPHIAGHAPSSQSYPMEQIWAPTQSSASISASTGDVQAELDGGRARLSVPAVSLPPAATSSEPLSPIWSEGVEQEFEADVYPSSRAAAEALGWRMAAPIRTVAGDPNAMARVTLFQENNERGLIAAFGHAIEKGLPNLQYSVEADLRNIRTDEVALTLRQDEWGQETRQRKEGSDSPISDTVKSGRIVGTAFTSDRQTKSATVRFIEKPWVDNFASFAGEKPDRAFIVARSNGTCTSESEANQQALEDARARITELVGKSHRWEPAVLPQPAITATDVLNGGFIADRFVQSFSTWTGRVWRQAILIDVSGPKLSALANQKSQEVRETRMSWARMGLSAVGVLALIGVIYFFLNMATRGYYEWSLRIAGVVLAVVAIVSILMIVQ